MNTIISNAATAKTAIDELAINHIGLVLWVSLFLLVFMVVAVIAFVKIYKYIKAMHLQNRRDYMRYNKILTESAAYHEETETLLAILYDLIMSHSSDMLNKAAELRTNIYLASSSHLDRDTVMLNSLLTLLDKPDMQKTAEFIEDIYGDGAALNEDTQRVHDHMMSLANDHVETIDAIDKELDKLESKVKANHTLQEIRDEMSANHRFQISPDGEKKLQPANMNPDELSKEEPLSHGTFIMVG